MIKHKKKVLAFSVILAIFFLSMVNGTISVAAYTPSSAGSSPVKEGDGLIFDIQKGYTIPENGYPIQYGAIIPDTNMWTSYLVHASNQGEFDIIEWDGDSEDTLTINNPGDDISLMSPWYFDYYLNSLTDNDYIDPWDIRWLQANASIAENDTPMPYTVNSVWNYYVMTEGSSLTVPLKDKNPIQVDIIVGKTGPKVLKCNKIADYDVEVDEIAIVSPSGKEIEFIGLPALYLGVEFLFWYYIFVAHEVGTYRLLLQEDDTPDYLEIEFLDFNLKTLPINTLTYGGTCDETPSEQDMYDNEWTIEWYKSYGNKGDKFTLELEEDLFLGGGAGAFLWYPTCGGYEFFHVPFDSLNEIYLPITGNFYISVCHMVTGGLISYSLLLNPISVTDYNIGDPLTTIKILRDERKAIEFEVPQDSFVRFNFTKTGFSGPSPPYLSDINFVGASDASFVYEDAKKIDCYEIIDYIDFKTVSGEEFYYYYMPAGTYEAIIYNDEEDKDGILQISSKYVNWTDDYIPVNTLSYPELYPSQFASVEFEPDEDYPSLKQAKVLNFEITEPGQYHLNTTILASENLGAIPATGSPSYFFTYNRTDGNFYDSGYPIPAFSTDGDSTDGSLPPDIFFIGAPCKWTGALFNLTTNGTAGQMRATIWDGGNWWYLDATDGTNDLYHNGTIEADVSDFTFQDWDKGVPTGYGFDIPMVNEDEYYWWLLYCDTDYDIIPIIESITLLNMTISGDINLVVLRDSGYEHCDVWWPGDMDQPAQITDFIISLDDDMIPYDSDASPIIKSGDPWTIGFEEGTYKLLIIPEHWDYTGKINIDFAIGNHWGYHVKDSYTIDSQPLAYPMNITDGPVIPGLHLYNYSTYPYDLEKTFNNTEVEILDNEGYFVLDCSGTAYDWTQLVLAFQNITNVDIWLMQDLPWVDNDGPNYEVRHLASTAINDTFEFGVLSDHFTLIFEYVDAGINEIIGFKIGLSQYDTGILTTSALMAVAVPAPGDGGGGDRDLWEPEEIPGWVPIGVIAGIGAGIVAIVIYAKKKGRGE